MPSDKEDGQCPRCGAQLLRHRTTGAWVAGQKPSVRTHGLAIAGFVLGLLGFVLFWLPLLIGLLMAVTGAVLAGDGRAQAKVRNAPTGLATAGIVLGASGTFLWLILVVVGIVALFA